MTLKAQITIPSQIVSSSGSVNNADTRIFSFKSLLSEPDFSDVSVKCGERVFPCHRVILAKR